MEPQLFHDQRSADEAYDLYLRCLAKDMHGEALFNLDKAIDYCHPQLLGKLSAERKDLAARLNTRRLLSLWRPWKTKHPAPIPSEISNL